MAKRIKMMPVTLKHEDIKNNKGRPIYRHTKKIDFKMKLEDTEKSAKLFEIAKNILYNTSLDLDLDSNKHLNVAAEVLGKIEFDNDAATRKLEEAVHKSNMRGGIMKYLKL